MTAAIEAALEDLRGAFAGHAVEVHPEPQGGAYVLVYDLEIGQQYDPACSWVGFLITFQYPHADVYPHFLVDPLRRTNDAPLGEGFGQTQWRDKPVTQVSRRSNRWDPTKDTAALKLAKVLEWIRSR